MIRRVMIVLIFVVIGAHARDKISFIQKLSDNQQEDTREKISFIKKKVVKLDKGIILTKKYPITWAHTSRKPLADFKSILKQSYAEAYSSSYAEYPPGMFGAYDSHSKVVLSKPADKELKGEVTRDKVLEYYSDVIPFQKSPLDLIITDDKRRGRPTTTKDILEGLQ